MKKLKVLDLFSGLGGFSLGLERTGHFETVAFCDNNKYSKLVIDKHWKGIKIYDDIREITKEKFTTDGIETPDIITGGVPCQPFSVAGKQKGTSDDRYLWPEMFRIIKAFKSKFVIVENVRGIVNIENGMVFETVCSDLESEGYEVQTFNIPAAGVGAPHRRERIWFIAVREETKSNMAESESVRFRGRSGQERGIEKQELQQSEQERSEVRSEVERRSSQSRTNVANTITRNVETGRERQRGVRTESEGQGASNNVASSSETSRKTKDVADTNSERSQRYGKEYKLRENSQKIKASRSSTSKRDETDVANAESSLGNDVQTITGTSKFETQEVSRNRSSIRGESTWWHVEPNVGRVAHGVSGRVHRLKGLGNSIIPQIVEEIGYAIVKAMK